MKVIDLLTKIAKGEEVPKKIRYEGKDMFWCEPCKIYEVDVEQKELCGTDLYSILDNLNDEVEVIEEKEETKPITKESIEALGYACREIQKCFINSWNKSLKNEPLIEEDKKIKKVSECFTSTDNKEIQFLIDNINQLGNKINEIIDKINKMEDK